MPRQRFLRSVRLLAQCYQAFERLSGRHVRALGLTPAQFDVLATLGNQQAMSFRELGRLTLITKGTLTGVVARLEQRGLVERSANESDRRSSLVRLTEAGNAMFAEVFAEHVAYCARAFATWRPGEFDALERQLLRLRAALEPGEQQP
ncbi:MAG: MarR family transcriptional regulator [Burkholderiaceae bacterium]|nr:MarR family transcriptional regulator [Burkholderiaceae bacterium]